MNSLALYDIFTMLESKDEYFKGENRLPNVKLDPMKWLVVSFPYHIHWRARVTFEVLTLRLQPLFSLAIL